MSLFFIYFNNSKNGAKHSTTIDLIAFYMPYQLSHKRKKNYCDKSFKLSSEKNLTVNEKSCFNLIKIIVNSFVVKLCEAFMESQIKFFDSIKKIITVEYNLMVMLQIPNKWLWHVIYSSGIQKLISRRLKNFPSLYWVTEEIKKFLWNWINFKIQKTSEKQ